jgi:hypothetical protein
MYRQYLLQSGQRQTIGWIDTDKPLRKGQRLTTREHGPQTIWTIARAGRLEVAAPPDQRWRVGGIVDPPR